MLSRPTGKTSKPEREKRKYYIVVRER